MAFGVRKLSKACPKVRGACDRRVGRALQRPRVLGWAAAVLLAAPGPVCASPLFELIGAGFGEGGWNGRATSPSAASSYFNPALLPQADQGLELGWLVLNDSISIALDGRSPDADIGLGNVNTLRDRYPVPTVWLEEGCVAGGERLCLTDIPATPRQSRGSSGNTRLYQAVGFVNHILEGRWSLGVYAALPIGSLLQAHSFFSDEREQYFTNSLHAELYSDRLTPMSLAFGTGVRATDWLSLGLSVTLNLLNGARASTYVGDSAFLDETLLLSTEVDASIGVAPHFSVLLEPLERLSASLVVHTPQKFEITADSGTFLANGNSQRAKRTNVHSWLPWTIAAGLAFQLYREGAHTISVAGTGMFRRWSSYLNRQGERPLSGYEWADTFAGVVGARYGYAEQWSAFLDFAYEPTPVPLQTGRTNYVDNDRFGTSAGVSYTWPLDDSGVRLRLGAQAQFHFLRARHQGKLDPRATPTRPSLVVDEWPDGAEDFNGDRIPEAQGLNTNNPGWPGFESSGAIRAAMLTAGLLY
ncbi:MAG: hypothetical protein OXU20_11250 [Myxococcales bacterium]|nr:hypothetical protein [Myxococcales bacterium]MDD9966326.1 hypothetical protein [Myxococcales bacterium]